MQPAKSTLGIDEAGRGSLVGPMILSGLFAQNRAEIEFLKESGVDDSKKLSPSKRETVYERIKHLNHKSIMYFPPVIDEKNINHLEIAGVKELYREFMPKILVWDAPVAPSGLERLIRHLRYLLDWNPASREPHLVVENKADQNYFVCMGASIIAKVTRDREVDKLRGLFGDFGSGYPSDPKTIAFIEKLGGNLDKFKPHVRHKWSTWKNISSRIAVSEIEQERELTAPRAP